MTSAARQVVPSAPGTRLSIPRRRHVLATIAETYGEPLRRIVTMLATDYCRHEPVASASSTATSPVSKTAASTHAAWHLVTRWVVGNALGALRPQSSFADALVWFTGADGTQLTTKTGILKVEFQETAQHLLWPIADPSALADLLPYILDPHGPGSRLSVMRDPSTRAIRDKKRSGGVFYTPPDVAEYMTKLAIEHLPPSHPVTVLDPACGTGVYLRAALAALIERHPTSDPLTLAEQSLFGIDIDAWAVDAAAYVLLHDVLAVPRTRTLSPAAVWGLLRLNLQVADALQLDPASGSETADGARLSDRVRRQAFHTGRQPPENAAVMMSGRVPIDHLFPGIGPGPRIVLGNPPYASLGPRRDLALLGTIFDTLRPVAPTVDIHSLFVEQMVRLSAPESSGVLVLPLSIAFNTRAQYTAVRHMIERTRGTWRFSFFDREPHALFGENVKTRNAIVAWSRSGTDASSRIMTGPLLKWRGNSRAHLFSSIQFTEVRKSIRNGIPKLGGMLQSQVLTALEETSSHAPKLDYDASSLELAECFDADRCTVFVASTAYNFLNVFAKLEVRVIPQGEMTTNTIYALRCRNPADAMALYALLSSRIAFWLWHTLGDGFHVTRTFLEDIPLRAAHVNADDRHILAELGTRLWHEVRAEPVVSYNRGRFSLAFPASRHSRLQKEIDQIIISAAALPGSFAREIDAFVNSVVAADPCGPVAENPTEFDT